MQLEMSKAPTVAQLSLPKGSVAFVGKRLDDRGKHAIDELQKVASVLVETAYNPVAKTVSVADKVLQADRLVEWVRSEIKGAVYLESTTLGFVEVLLLLRSLRESGVGPVRILYVEPKAYTKSKLKQPNAVITKRDFSLSGRVHGYIGIPLYTGLVGAKEDQSALFFLGYEERRLLSAVEEHPFDHTRCCVAFGVPAFQPGWEMDAFANNVPVIDREGIRGGVYFCGAENPLAAYGVVKKVYDGLAKHETLFVAPIGTKPHGIGTALFASEHSDLKILYDHPVRTSARTSDVGNWHLFTVLS